MTLQADLHIVFRSGTLSPYLNRFRDEVPGSSVPKDEKWILEIGKGFKITLILMTVAWVVGAWMFYDYSGSLGPGSYMGLAMIGITWAVWKFMY